MQLTKRLLAIAELVEEGSRVADIGTDHGYIPIYLRKYNKASYCIASDINKGPLESARKNITKYSVDGIVLRQGSGLCTLQENDKMDVAIIAGMGGPLIIDILRNDLTIVKGLRQLILQPQSNIPEVRKFVHSIGFKIRSEKALVDEEKFYIILDCVPGNEVYQQSYEYEYGKYLLEHPNQVFKEWLQKKDQQLKKLVEHLETIQSEDKQKRLQEIQATHHTLKEALKCI